jgi:chemotaxis protein methyltransferase CheR
VIDAMPLALPATSLRPLSGREFRLFQQIILDEAGIFLADAKTALLVSRLSKRLRELGCPSFSEYYDRVRTDDAERARMVERICTHETAFFREPKHFELLEQQVFPEWEAQARAGRRERTVRAWSAGCSSGEEPYSLAMSLLASFPAKAGWRIELLATDLSAAVLERARAAVWPVERASRIPTRHLKRFMLRGVGKEAGKMKAGPVLRSAVCFQQVNLRSSPLSVAGGFDLIFCRNVLIYFAPELRQQALDRLLDHLVAHGLLFLGHAETLSHAGDRVRLVMPTVYEVRPLPQGAKH